MVPERLARVKRSGGLLLALLTALLALAGNSAAHESRPAYLEIQERDPGRYDLLWRTPVLSGMRLPVALQLSAGYSELAEPVTQHLSDSLLERH